MRRSERALKTNAESGAVTAAAIPATDEMRTVSSKASQTAA